MVHCISSSEPDSGDPTLVGLETDWRLTQGTVTKEMTVNHLDGLLHGKTFVESTVTTGIQVGNTVEPDAQQDAGRSPSCDVYNNQQYFPQSDTPKYMSFGIAPSGLYPHLYNARSQPEVAVVDYEPHKQTYYNVYDNVAFYGQNENFAESDDSSEGN